MSAAPPRLAAAGLGVPHGFFTRAGGVSTGPYASLNGSLSGGDDRVAVTENRRRVAVGLGVASNRLLGLTQVHGVEVVTVTQPWALGDGTRADAMVTSQGDIGLVVITADCAPVLFADAQAGVIGAAHAGWRGAVAGVLEATIEVMRALGATRIAACVGPCIGAASYQVGADLRDAVLSDRADAAGFFAADAPDGGPRWRFDLAGYCAARLEAAGAAVQVLGRDTYAEPDQFFSHRRRTLAGGGPIGHQMSAIRR